MMDYYRAYVAVNENKANEIERATRGQGSADETTANVWLTERRKRITSSAAGTISKRRSTTEVGNLVKTLLYSSFKGNTATRYGHEQEQATRNAYLTVKQKSSPNIAVTDSGLVIHPTHNWLAASPDNLVYDPTSADPHGIVEYKNPYKFRSSTLVKVATETKNFCLANNNGLLSLKHTHDYYYQVHATTYVLYTAKVV